MFIELDKKGNIAASADFKFSDSAIETSRNIVHGYDGKLYFEDEVPTTPVEILQSRKLWELKKSRDKYKENWGYSDNIYSNLKDGLTSNPELLEKYRDFLSNLITKYDTFKGAIKTAQTQEDLDKIEIAF
jgi:hypothetical protein